jgi:AraC-like DNA-binding protein
MHSRPARPLDRFPLVRTGNTDELKRLLAIEFGVHRFEPIGGRTELFAWINRLQVGAVDFTYSKFSVQTELAFKADDIVRLQFVLCGRANVRVGATRLLIAENDTCVTPAYAVLEQRFEPDFERLVLRFSERTLRRKLEAMLGIQVNAPIEFTTVKQAHRPDIAVLREFALDVLSSPHTSIPDASEAVRAELGQSWMVALLHGTAHNYSHLLTGECKSAAAGQVHLAVDYIESNWNRPLMIEDIAAAVGVSSRSLFKSFKESMRITPMAYARTVRLRKANKMLSEADRATTVGAVALTCGFLNAGHFAKDYREEYGESPSVTLARARTLMRSRKLA